MKRTKPCACPHCGRMNDAITDILGHDTPPSEGDASMCTDCGEWLILNADLTGRKPTDDEYVELGMDEDAVRVRAIWTLFDKHRREHSE